MSNWHRYLFALAALLFWGAGAAAAMSPEALRTVLSDPGADRVVVVDIRNPAEFRSGHIPGSMHIHVVGIEARSVPPFGQVVVIWDGIDPAEAARALRALNAKPGIEAELVEGGYPAWTASGGRTSGVPGLEIAVTPSLSYEDLLKLALDPDLVVVDLREADEDTLTDLNALLPNARILAPHTFGRREMKRSLHTKEGLDHQGVRKRHSPRWLRGQALDESGLYVLIDAGDGRMSERVARRMAARGLNRVYVLIGGERILQSNGKSGSLTLSRPGEGSQ